MQPCGRMTFISSAQRQLADDACLEQRLARGGFG